MTWYIYFLDWWCRWVFPATHSPGYCPPRGSRGQPFEPIELRVNRQFILRAITFPTRIFLPVHITHTWRQIILWKWLFLLVTQWYRSVMTLSLTVAFGKPVKKWSKLRKTIWFLCVYRQQVRVEQVEVDPLSWRRYIYI